MKYVAHAFNLLFLAVFVLSVLVQYNDPDPLPWMVMYGLAAVACLLYLIGRLPWLLAAGVGAVALVWMLTLLLPVFTGTGDIGFSAVFGTTDMINERVELVREAGGLGIILFWMVVLTLLTRRN